MKMPRLVSILIALPLLSAAAVQAQTATPVGPGCAWNCYDVVLPYGLYVRDVKDGGSFVTLEDGSIYEIRIPQRPVAASWQPGDFVRLSRIWSPVQDFEILLSHGDSDRADARLSGRQRAPAQE
ncbi:MAG TPA: hypothetical protein VFU40_05800 [Gemmatimonadales bacterium]|nr:hypothetical protein [Gemmatimonadales bacterium]